MPLKEMQPRLQLSFEEFAETWSALIEEYYRQAVDPALIEQRLHLSDEQLVCYTAELAAALLFVATEIWDSRKRISPEIRRQSSEAIIAHFYRSLYSDEAETSLALYQTRRTLFSQLTHELASADPQKRQPELIGFARYLIAQISDAPEQENMVAIQQLSMILIEAASTFVRFANNSFPDMAGFGKPKFIVQK